MDYKLTGQSGRSGEVVHAYHYSPRPIPLNRAKKGDVEGLKAKGLKSIRKVDPPCFCNESVFNATPYQGTQYEHEARFTIGMEIEKNEFDECCEQEFALLKGFERDSSCGYDSGYDGREAITNILPLLPSGKWRNKVFNMMWEAECVIDDDYSPSNRRCGGHITVGAIDENGRKYSGDEIRRTMRKNMGIILALNRLRLNNEYCYANPRLKAHRSNRYSVALPKECAYEVRLFSRFTSVPQMIRRYELMYEIMDFSFNTPTAKHKSLLKRVKPIVKMMYGGDEIKTAQILQMAHDFRNFIVRNTYTSEIERFLRSSDRYQAVQVDSDYSQIEQLITN